MEGHSNPVLTSDHDTLLQPTPPFIDENMASSETSDNPPEPPTTFSSLPFELRTDIFSLAIPLPRLLLMNFRNNREFGMYAESSGQACIPTILHINHESRTVGLRIFKLHFGATPTQLVPGRTPGDRDLVQSYWNPSADTLYLPFVNGFENHPSLGMEEHIGESFNSGNNDINVVGSEVYHKAHILSHVRHIAVLDNHRTISSPQHRPRTHPDTEIIHPGDFTLENLDAWIPGFTRLTSVTVLREPFAGWYWSSETLGWGDEDTQEARGRRAETHRREIQQGLPDSFQATASFKNWESQSVEHLLKLTRRTKGFPIFCIPQGYRSFESTMRATPLADDVELQELR